MDAWGRTTVHILLVEDDQLLGDGLANGLKLEGHVVDWLTCGRDAEAADVESDFDAVILDLGLPGVDGKRVLQRWRRNNVSVPVLVLTAYDRDAHCAETLDIGADDYVTKPIPMAELSARLRAIQRRAAGGADNLLEQGALRLDRERRTGFLGKRPLELSTFEYTILEILLERAGKPVGRDTLEARLYGWEDGPESNSLEVLIHKLRGKIGRNKIKTVRGLGYRLDP